MQKSVLYNYPMHIYIEYVIIDNFTLTYLISVLSYRALKVSISKRRCVIASITGTVAAIFYPFIGGKAYVLLIFRLLLLFVLSYILFNRKSKILLSSAVFLGITFLFGGTFFAVGYLLYGDVMAALTRPIADFPLGILLIGGCVISSIIKRLLMRFHKNRDAKAFVFPAKLTVFSKEYSVNAFVDTGNRVYDLDSGLPVAILSFELTQKILPSETIIQLIGGQKNMAEFRIMECVAFGGKREKLWLVKAEKFLLYFGGDENIWKGDKNINIDIMLGMSLHPFRDTTSYSIILGSSVLNMIEDKKAA